MSDFYIYGDSSSVVVRRYEEETAELSIDEEYTVEPGHVVAYHFTAPEDGTYAISQFKGYWCFWYSEGRNSRYFSAGDTDVIYVCVPEQEDPGSTVFKVSKVEE